MTLDFFFKNAWRWAVGLPEEEWELSTIEIHKTEWSKEFEALMRNRLVMGALRYGRLRKDNKPQYDRISTMFMKLKRYEFDGNTELLVDIANCCLLEFVEGNHPKKHFYSSDDKEHVKTIS